MALLRREVGLEFGVRKGVPESREREKRKEEKKAL